MDLILHIGYFFSLLALSVRDILWLRCFLMVAHLSLISHALLHGNRQVAFWHTVFISINMFRIIRLLRERAPIELPGSVRDLYDEVFNVMTPREFLFFWETGTVGRAEDEVLVREGDRQQRLSLLLDGNVAVRVRQQEVARLERGRFVAEMSFLSGNPASADVVAEGPVEYISWEQEKLKSLELLNPKMMIKIQGILGKDLAEKVKATSAGTSASS